MRFLADENFPLPVIERMRMPGHDVLWARTDYPGVSDSVLLDLAETDRRILLTLDKDFRQIALQRREPLLHSGVILFRVHPAIPENMMLLVDAALSSATDWAGRITTVTKDGISSMPSKLR